jgi:hypothetical protein
MTDDDLRAIGDLCVRVLNGMEAFSGEARRLSSSLAQLHRDHADIRAMLKERGGISHADEVAMLADVRLVSVAENFGPPADPDVARRLALHVVRLLKALRNPKGGTA